MSSGEWTKKPTRRQRMVELVNANPGITAADVAGQLGITMHYCYDELVALAKMGRVDKHGARSGVRWSAPGVRLDMGKAKRKPATRKPVPGAQQVVKGGTVSPKPVRQPTHVGPPIITDKTIRTIDSRQYPTARWQTRQEAPDERWPSFAAARPGMDPLTGRAWA